MSHTRSLALIGFMGSGKTTIGRRCSRLLGLDFADCDAAIEAEVGMSIADYFAAQGEESFRTQESRMLARLCEAGPRVISTGGGVVLRAENRVVLRSECFVVLLDVSVETILSRVAGRSHRPLLNESADPRQRIEALLSERRPAYLAAADAVVRTSGMSKEAAAHKVCDLYRGATTTEVQT